MKNGSWASSVFTVVLSSFNLMVNDDAHTRDWAREKKTKNARNKLELRPIALTEWWRGKNIPAIHTLISDDDALMKIKDDHAGDNYADENNEVEDFTVCAAGFPLLCGFWKQRRVTVPYGAWWCKTRISRHEHTASREQHFVIFCSGQAPGFMMVPICV